MAERRMFAKSIIDSDNFIDMPTSSRLLYYDLSMRADDDGFVNSPKKIMKMTGASDDDLKLLIAKKFLIPFESGVVVIKHWKIHNYIQKDRYKETIHLEEKGLLSTLENKEYSLDTQCIQSGYSLDTQVRLGKDSRGKGSIVVVEDNNNCHYNQPNYIQEYINKINPTCHRLELEKLSSWLDDGIEEDLITEAINEAVLNNVRNYKYIAGILNRCLDNGVKTKEQFIAEKNIKKGGKDGNRNNEKSRTDDTTEQKLGIWY